MKAAYGTKPTDAVLDLVVVAHLQLIIKVLHGQSVPERSFH